MTYEERRTVAGCSGQDAPVFSVLTAEAGQRGGTSAEAVSTIDSIMLTL